MTAVEESFTDAKKLAADPLASKKTLVLNGRIDVSRSCVIESGRLDSYLETRLRNLADSTIFTDSITCRIMMERSSITVVTHFVKNTGIHQVNVATVQPRFQEAVHAPCYDHKLESVEIISPAERTPTPLILSRDENKKSRRKRSSRRSSYVMSKRSSSSLSRDAPSLSP